MGGRKCTFLTPEVEFTRQHKQACKPTRTFVCHEKGTNQTPVSGCCSSGAKNININTHTQTRSHKCFGHSIAWIFRTTNAAQLQFAAESKLSGKFSVCSYRRQTFQSLHRAIGKNTTSFSTSPGLTRPKTITTTTRQKARRLFMKIIYFPISAQRTMLAKFKLIVVEKRRAGKDTERISSLWLPSTGYLVLTTGKIGAERKKKKDWLSTVA